MIADSGVRSSCDMTAKNSPLARFALSASCRALRTSCSALCCSVTSQKIATPAFTFPCASRTGALFTQSRRRSPFDLSISIVASITTLPLVIARASGHSLSERGDPSSLYALIAEIVLDSDSVMGMPITCSAARFAMIRSPDGASTIEIASGDCSTTVISRLCSAWTCSVSRSPSTRARRSEVMSRKKIARPSAVPFILMSNQEPGATSNSNGSTARPPIASRSLASSSGAIHLPHISQRFRPTIEGPMRLVSLIPSRLSCLIVHS